MTCEFVPKKIFIVPYRNREEQKFFFCKYMSFLLEDINDYEIYFSHQCDDRPFNRGAIKNIGFLAMKEKYPNHYKNINFIFNDIDTIPYNKLFDYTTSQGIVKHYYGFEYTLGGIVVIKGYDFERINGYPNFWGWGMEDSCLQKRCNLYNLKIDRTVFYPIGSPEILQLFDGVSRIISKRDTSRMKKDDGVSGLKSIQNIIYDNEIYNLDLNMESFFYINVNHFITESDVESDAFYKYDLREPVRKIIYPDKKNEYIVDVNATTNNWTNIPYYPTLEERKKYRESNKNIVSFTEPIFKKPNPIPNYQNQPVNIKYPPSKQQPNIINKNNYYNPILNSNTNTISNTNVFTQEYAKTNSKPGTFASKSVNIGLGGIR